MTTVRIFPYKQSSQSAKALALRTGILRATEKQIAKHKDFNIIINWGSSQRRFHGQYINNPEAVAIATDKIEAARAFTDRGISHPAWTTSRDTAEGWVVAGSTILCRSLTRANGGRGIWLTARPTDRQQSVTTDAERTGGTYSGRGRVGRRDTLIDAPLYTKYVKKSDEYRVHVFNNVIIDVQQKMKRRDTPNEDVDYQIRNGGRGWVYCRSEIACPTCVLDIAGAAVDALGLDFGAVDIGYNQHHGCGTVYEVNTAPGLEGATLDSYRAAIETAIPAIATGVYKRRRDRCK